MILLEFLRNLKKRYKIRREKQAAEELVRFRALLGYSPGGMYPGITCIPGDPNKPWIRGEAVFLCPACNIGMMHHYWQNDEYKILCDNCNYLYDTGRRMTDKEFEECSKYFAIRRE